MIGTIKAASNPTAYVQNMIQKAITEKNPHLFKALNFIKENGNDAKAAFEKLAAENGINPADIGL